MALISFVTVSTASFLAFMLRNFKAPFFLYARHSNSLYKLPSLLLPPFKKQVDKKMVFPYSVFMKFLDPKNDFVFGRIFGSDANKPILIHTT